MFMYSCCYACSVLYILFSFCCSVYCLCVNVYLQLPPGVNPIAVNKYIKLKPIPVCLENIRPFEISGYRRGVVKAFAPLRCYA